MTTEETTLLNDSQREALVAYALSWVNTPYHHLADVRGAGVDCAMLLVRLYVDTGLLPPFDPRPYSPQWHQNRTAEAYLSWLDIHGSITDNPLPGDVAVWRWREDRPYSHGGILVEGDSTSGIVVHALRPAGRVCRQSINEAPLHGKSVRWYTVKPQA